MANAKIVFVPSLGDFFSIRRMVRLLACVGIVFVPSLGDFFSITVYAPFTGKWNPGFRPLSRGLFFNCLHVGRKCLL